MIHGKQLRLFLPDGTPSGPRYYELVNWTGQALQIPLNRIKDLISGDWPEFQSPGVYLVRTRKAHKKQPFRNSYGTQMGSCWNGTN